MEGLKPLSRYFDFNGRSGRAEFWQWMAISTVGGWIVQALQTTAAPSFATPARLMMPMYALGTLIPTIAVGIRRLHDRGKSGKRYGALLVAIAASVCLIIAGRISIDQTGNETLMQLGLGLTVAWMLAAIFQVIEWAKPGDAGNNAFGPPDMRQPTLTASPAPVRYPPPQPAVRTAALSPAVLSETDAASLATQIEGLARLNAQGALSDAEFTSAKARVLSGRDPAVHGGYPPPIKTSPVPTRCDWEPASATWQARFEFFDRIGIDDLAAQRLALKAISMKERTRLSFSVFGFVLGPIYFLYLGLWRAAVTIFLGGVAMALLVSPLLAAIFGVPEASIDKAIGFAFAGLSATAVVPLYYLRQRYGIESWNPFRRKLVV